MKTSIPAYIEDIIWGVLTDAMRYARASGVTMQEMPEEYIKLADWLIDMEIEDED